MRAAAARAIDSLGRGRELLGSKDFEAAERCLRSALALAPGCAEAYELLGKLLYRDGRSDEAAALYRRWHEAMPAHPVARHMFAATSGLQTPPRASDEFLLNVYDRAAETFDTALATLGYRAPQLLFEATTELLGAAAARLDVLDLGCGTGLCGEWLRAVSARLTGVDLSQAMLDKARRRDCYDELVCEEIMSYARRRAAMFDLIFAADVFCYFGDLEPVFSRIAGLLRHSGSFVFSVEELSAQGDGPQAVLLEHGRYAHSLESVSGALRASGLLVEVVRGDMLRFERGAPVTGLIVVARQQRNATDLSKSSSNRRQRRDGARKSARSRAKIAGQASTQQHA
jgi:predicted TPR repeat methyltransferase